MLYQLSYASNYLFTTMYITSTSADQVGCPHFVPVARVSFERLFPQCTDRHAFLAASMKIRLKLTTLYRSNTDRGFLHQEIIIADDAFSGCHRARTRFRHWYGESRRNSRVGSSVSVSHKVTALHAESESQLFLNVPIPARHLRRTIWRTLLSIGRPRIDRCIASVS